MRSDRAETTATTAAPLPASVETTNSGTELARGAIVNIVTLVAANLRGIFTFLIARLLGQGTLGTFGIAWSTTDLLSKFGTFGMDTSSVALVAGREARGDTNGSRILFHRAVMFGLLFSVMAALLGILDFPDDRPGARATAGSRAHDLAHAARAAGHRALPHQQRRLARHESDAARPLLARLHRDIRHHRLLSRGDRHRIAPISRRPLRFWLEPEPAD